MKEYTVITTIQFTDVFQREDYALIPKAKVEEMMGMCVDADNIKVIKQQVFSRDLPNTDVK